MNLLIDVPIHQLYHKIDVKRSNRGDKECDLKQFSIYDILEMVGDGTCQYTGKPFENLEDASFERINPKLGYVKGNVIMVSREANTHKGMLDHFVKNDVIPNAMKIKLMRKALYQLEKQAKEIG